MSESEVNGRLERREAARLTWLSRRVPVGSILFASVEVLGWVKLSPPARPFNGQPVTTLQTFGFLEQVSRDYWGLLEVHLRLPSVLPERKLGVRLKLVRSNGTLVR